MKWLINSFFLTTTFLVVTSCTYEDNRLIDTNLTVVESYLIPNTPLAIKLSTIYVYNDDATNESETIIDAEVSIITESETYDLIYDASIGTYQIPDTTIYAIPGDFYELKINRDGQLVTSTTTVPFKPINSQLSSGSIVVDSDARPGPNEASVELTWESPEGQTQYLVVIEYLEEDYDPIFDFLEEDIYDDFRIRSSEPITGNSYAINQRQLIFYGEYRVIIHSINKEYADLYENVGQTSQNIAEPLTNIENGLGIFTGLNSDTLSLTVTN